MIPFLIPPAAGAAAVEAGAVAAWATVAAGSLIHSMNGLEFRQPRHLQLPPALGRGPSIQELIADAIAGAMVPVGSPENSPPPPGGGLQGLAAFIAAAAAAAGAWWQRFNRPRVPDSVGIWQNAPAGTMVSITTSPRLTSYQCTISMQVASWYGGWTFYTLPINNWELGQGDTSYRATNTTIELSAPSLGTGGVWLQNFSVRIDGTDANGAASWQGTHQRLIKAGTASVVIQPTETNTTGWATQTNITPPAPWTTPLPARTTARAPAIPELTAAAPAPAAPAPAAVPISESLQQQIGAMAADPLWLWSFDAAGQPAPSNGSSQAQQSVTTWTRIDTLTPLPSVPVLPRTITPLSNAGTVPATAPAPVTATDPTAHIINGIAISGATARADLASIAAELTRVESKLASMMRPAQERPSGEDWIDDLADLLELARSIYDLMTYDVPETEWQVVAPCDKNPDGTQKSIKIEFPTEDYLPAMLRRMEALMGVYGNTLAWRRGVCKGAVTNNVTITAYSIDPLTA